MKKLKRKYAFLSLALLICGVLFLWVPFLFYTSVKLGKIFVIGGIIMILSALVLKYILLKCPNCGFAGLVPQLSGNETYYCPKCGKKIKWE